MVKSLILTVLSLAFCVPAFAVTTQQIVSRYKIIGVISEDKPGEKDPKKKGGIAVIKDTSTGKTLVLKAGLPFPGQSDLKIEKIGKKSVVVKSLGKDIVLTQKGFSGFEGEVASTSGFGRKSVKTPGKRVNSKRPKDGFDPWGDQGSGTGGPSGEVPPPPPFPEEIDELFFQEFGEAPIPPEVFEGDQMNSNNRPLTREELMEKYDFDPEEFSNQELENMVSPPPVSPWGQ